LAHENGSRSRVAICNRRSSLRVNEPAHQRADENKCQKRKNAHHVMLLHDERNLYPPLDAGVERGADRGRPRRCGEKQRLPDLKPQHFRGGGPKRLPLSTSYSRPPSGNAGFGGARSMSESNQSTRGRGGCIRLSTMAIEASGAVSIDYAAVRRSAALARICVPRVDRNCYVATAVGAEATQSRTANSPRRISSGGGGHPGT